MGNKHRGLKIMASGNAVPLCVQASLSKLRPEISGSDKMLQGRVFLVKSQRPR